MQDALDENQKVGMTAGQRSRETETTRSTGLPLGYAPVPGTFDEMVDASGKVRAHWQALAEALQARPPLENQERFARAERYLRDAGIFHRDYGESGGPQRLWPLSPFPVLLPQGEWQGIAEGLSERADLLERVIADLYGENRLVAEGLLPPMAVAGNPEFLRPLVGIRPASGHFLHFLAFDVARGEDGRFRVLADRTQAPSGAGFTLENRVATTRAFSGLFDRSAVHRLAPFFARFRDTLQSNQHGQDERVGVLTPGRANATYFEHAYLARYLGFTLLEGEDLVVIDGELMVRTISGPKPVSVLWRRLASAAADPLELEEGSLSGTPGLLEAVRAGSVTMINALGSGILETGIISAHLPAIAERLNGKPLSLAAFPVLFGEMEADEDDCTMALGPAFATLPPFERNSGFKPTERRTVRDKPRAVLRAAPGLSLGPALQSGRLVPRPMILRFYAARTAEGWTIMPGGFARLGAGEQPGIFAFHEGGQSADLSIVSSETVPDVSLIAASGTKAGHRQGGNLPSRAADNLFWLGRYIERAEGALRILRAFHARLAENGDPDLPLLSMLTRYMATLEVDTAEPVPRMLLANIDSAVYSAGNIRDRFSPDGWMALTDLQKTAHRFAEKVSAGDDAAHAMTILLRKLAGFAGLVHENMYRFMGWRFLTIGRHLERGLHMTTLLAHLAQPDAPDGADDLLLDIGDNVMTHRRHYSVTTSTSSTVELMGLDPYNPRSVLFQLTEIVRSVSQLPDSAEDRLQLHRDIRALEQRLATAPASEVDADSFRQLEKDLEAFSDALALAYLT